MCRPCFLRTQQLAAENLRLRFELGAYEDQAGFLEEEQRRRTVAVNLTAKMCATETALAVTISRSCWNLCQPVLLRNPEAC